MFADLGAPPAYLLSEEEIPPSPLAKGELPGSFQWHSIDSAKNFKKNPHPTIGPDDVTYDLNRHGYRCPEFEDLKSRTENAVTVACIGSSGLFGTGLPEDKSLPYLIQDSLREYLDRDVVSVNLGIGGTGPDYVTRMLFSVIPVLDPDILILTTHAFNRREFFGESGKVYTTQSYPHWHQRFIDPERYQMHQVCKRISNPYNHVMFFLTNALVWESLCDSSDKMWLFMTEGFSDQLEPVNRWMKDARKMVGPGFFPLIREYRDEPSTGLARDMLHPGTLTTRAIADILFGRLIEVYGDRLDQLKRSNSSSIQG
jgi:hypothetical protein